MTWLQYATLSMSDFDVSSYNFWNVNCDDGFCSPLRSNRANMQIAKKFQSFDMIENQEIGKTLMNNKVSVENPRRVTFLTELTNFNLSSFGFWLAQNSTSVFILSLRFDPSYPYQKNCNAEWEPWQIKRKIWRTVIRSMFW